MAPKSRRSWTLHFTSALPMGSFKKGGWHNRLSITAERSKWLALDFRFPAKQLVCLLKRFLAADVQPLSLDLERVHRSARVEPFEEAPRLIRVVTLIDILGHEW